MSSELPNPIKEMMLNEANDKNEYKEMPNNYHITALVGCIRKTFYRKTLPKEKQTVDLETAKNFWRGNNVDRNFCKLFNHYQIRVTYRCQSVPICISGHFDFLNEDDPAAPVITDLKAPKTLFYIKQEGKTSESYRKQVLFYCHCTAIPQGAVMYWDGHNPLTYPIEVTDETERILIAELEAKAHTLYIALQNGKAPAKNAFPIESWECKYCNFVEVCNNE